MSKSKSKKNFWQDSKEETEVTTETNIKPMVVGAIKNLQVSYHEDVNRIVEQDKQGCARKFEIS